MSALKAQSSGGAYGKPASDSQAEAGQNPGYGNATATSGVTVLRTLSPQSKVPFQNVAPAFGVLSGSCGCVSSPVRVLELNSTRPMGSFTRGQINYLSLLQSCDMQYTTYAIIVTTKMTETRETRPLPGTSARWQYARAMTVRTKPKAMMSQPMRLSSEPVRPMEARITMVYLNPMPAGCPEGQPNIVN